MKIIIEIKDMASTSEIVYFFEDMLKGDITGVTTPDFSMQVIDTSVKTPVVVEPEVVEETQ